MSKARAVTEASFKDDVLDSEKTILVDFWAEWCGPCKAVGPILDEIADEHGDKIEIVKLNVDEHSHRLWHHLDSRAQDLPERQGSPDHHRRET